MKRPPEKWSTQAAAIAMVGALRTKTLLMLVPRRMRLVATENRVDILWNNFSELSPDLRLNVIDFESYRIWRADNWTRPFGTDVNTGPGSELWMLLAEFDLPRNGIGSDTGLESVRYNPNISDQAVEFYREFPINMDVVGDYHDLGVFFDRISKYSRIINVDNVQIAANNSGRGSIRSTFTATTFVYDDKAAGNQGSQQ